MKSFKIIISVISLFFLASCAYEEYIEDYDFSGTYFASQQPLRTVVARGDKNFEVGVTIGGLRADDGSHWVDFTIDSVLLDSLPEASGLTLLPASHYILGDESRFNIAKTFMRTVEVQLTDAFFADPLALTATYALPLRIVATSVDSIMGYDMDETTAVSSADGSNMDITILVLKYISPYSGNYYSKGVQYELAADGSYADTLTYDLDELNANDVIYLETLSENSVKTERIGGSLSGGWTLTINDDGTVTPTTDDVTVESATVSYSSEETTFTLDALVQWFGIKYKIEEQLILRQDPELDLRFEEWN